MSEMIEYRSLMFSFRATPTTGIQDVDMEWQRKNEIKASEIGTEREREWDFGGIESSCEHEIRRTAGRPSKGDVGSV